MSLLLAALNQGFQEVANKQERVEELLRIFRRLKPKNYNQQTEYKSSVEYLAGLAAGMQAERKYKLESKLLSKKEDHLYQDVMQILEKTLQEIKAEHRQTVEEVWEKVSEVFEKENGIYESLFDQCGERLEHVFDFMEAAFGSSQEMVVFVTGLNTSFYSIEFLQQYQCERYYQYNKLLLFDDQEKEMLRKIEKL